MSKYATQVQVMRRAGLFDDKSDEEIAALIAEEERKVELARQMARRNEFVERAMISALPAIVSAMLAGHLGGHPEGAFSPEENAAACAKNFAERLADAAFPCGEHQPVPDAASAAPAPPPADIKPGDVPWQVGQVWETQNGQKVTILNTHFIDECPILGTLESPGTSLRSWRGNGKSRYFTRSTDDLDLVRLISPLPAAPAEPAAHECVIGEILDERRRQMFEENFSPEDDDYYVNGQFAAAAASYALHARSDEMHARAVDLFHQKKGPGFWPWSTEWWKPKSRRRDLIRAAALIVAEIERLDRASAVSVPKPDTAPTEPASDDEGWIPHDGKSWPRCAPGDVVDVKFRDDAIDKSCAGSFAWFHCACACDVLAYRRAKAPEAE